MTFMARRSRSTASEAISDLSDPNVHCLPSMVQVSLGGATEKRGQQYRRRAALIVSPHPAAPRPEGAVSVNAVSFGAASFSTARLYRRRIGLCFPSTPQVSLWATTLSPGVKESASCLLRILKGACVKPRLEVGECKVFEFAVVNQLGSGSHLQGERCPVNPCPRDRLPVRYVSDPAEPNVSMRGARSSAGSPMQALSRSMTPES